MSLSVDEEFNRINVGLEDPSARAAVLDLAVELAVPVEMISFTEESPPELLSMSAAEPRPPFSASHTLKNRIPDGKLRGGYKIQAPGQGGCTLAFPAVMRSRSATEVFVSSSHCSRRPMALDSSNVGQPLSLNVVGYEIRDPETHDCDNDEGCRHADAALNRATADIALGEIARTDERVYCGKGCEETKSLEVDAQDPTISISGYALSVLDNDVLDKVGQETGWTYGEVVHTCKDTKSATDSVVRLCSGAARLASDEGDSGAPVFVFRDTGTAQLKGIVWGRDRGSTESYFSNYARIERDLGGMWVYDPGPPVVEYITGPPFVPRGYVCLWTALVHGMDPLHYDWSGVIKKFTGTNHGVLGSPKESGWLKVEATDILDRRVRDSTYVTVTDYVVLPVGCFPAA